MKPGIILFVVFTLIFSGHSNILPQASAVNAEEIMKRAGKYYEEKKFAESLNEWLAALELDPGNERIQQQIEALYEEKHKKDMSLQRSKILYWEAKVILERLKNGSSDFYDLEFKRAKLTEK